VKKTAKQTVRGSLRATKKFVSQLGGRPTAASGSGLEKADGRVPGRFRIETKCPPTGKYRFMYVEWEKLRNAAISANEIAVFHMKLHGAEFVVLRMEDYIGLWPNSLATMKIELGVKKGRTFSKEGWLSVLTEADRLHFAIQDTHRILHHFVAMPATTFISLSEDAC
jgi:hypothetical protein